MSVQLAFSLRDQYPVSQTDGQTDRPLTCDGKTTKVHRVLKITVDVHSF